MKFYDMKKGQLFKIGANADVFVCLGVDGRYGRFALPDDDLTNPDNWVHCPANMDVTEA